MKSTVAPYETSVRCLRVECLDGTIINLTRYPYDLTMSNATVYLSAAGADFSTSVAETTFAASSFDLEGFVGLAGIGRDDVASGMFDGADCKLFKTSFLTPVEDEEPMDRATLGRTILEDDGYRIEMMGLVDLLSQPTVSTVSPMCRNIFGGQEYGGCKVNLAAITVTGTLTSVTSSLVVGDTARTEAADYFGAGVIRFTSGDNLGLADIRVDGFSAGVLTLANAPYYPVTIGTTYELEPGCRKRVADCQAHSNIARMRAYPYVPPKSVYTSIGGT